MAKRYVTYICGGDYRAGPRDPLLEALPVLVAVRREDLGLGRPWPT